LSYDTIKILEELEHVRLRPGMYIGSTETPLHLCYEVLDNALDEANNGLFTANYRLTGRVISKHFSVAKYSENLTLALTIKYRHIKMRELIDNGDSYTERHIGEYSRLPILNNYSDSQIKTMLNDSLKSTNTTGFKGVSFRH
jgi:hypothetical protein